MIKQIGRLTVVFLALVALSYMEWWLKFHGTMELWLKTGWNMIDLHCADKNSFRGWDSRRWGAAEGWMPSTQRQNDSSRLAFLQHGLPWILLCCWGEVDFFFLFWVVTGFFILVRTQFSSRRVLFQGTPLTVLRRWSLKSTQTSVERNISVISGVLVTCLSGS